MQNNLGTILGGIALFVSLGNSYFLYDLSKNKTTEEASLPSNTVAEPNAAGNPMAANPMADPFNQAQQQPAPPQPTGPPTTMSFKEMDHDFGKIKQETENKYEFSFTNTGKNPLIITNAQGSCGCTVPEYPKEPIAPGASSKIKVVYSPGQQEGKQNKTVTITANTDPQQTVLAITAEVLKK